MARPYALQQIRETLASLYDKKAMARRVADDAFGSTSDISFEGDIRTVWHVVLQYADKRNQVVNVIEIAKREYSTNEQLLETLDNLMQDYYLEKISGINAQDFRKTLDGTISRDDPRIHNVRERLIHLSMVQENIVDWKDLHNCLDLLNNTIRDFKLHVEGFTIHDFGNYRDLVRRFGAIEESLRSIEDWVSNTNLKDESDAYVKISSLHRDLESQVDLFSDLEPASHFSSFGHKEYLKQNLQILWDTCRRYESEVSIQMTIADKRLLSEARKLSA